MAIEEFAHAAQTITDVTTERVEGIYKLILARAMRQDGDLISAKLLKLATQNRRL
ncbi:MAG TPA: hypothetical protein VE170_00595 [Candidatus Limnocylindria bacterium]|nr:hypothetical protein [Candidatus Limnocylindria bacterium]